MRFTFLSASSECAEEKKKGDEDKDKELSLCRTKSEKASTSCAAGRALREQN